MKVLMDKHTIDPKHIAALTPYSAQREEIRKQMKKQRVSGVEVKTITESQGKQRKILDLYMSAQYTLADVDPWQLQTQPTVLMVSINGIIVVSNCYNVVYYSRV